MWSYGLDLTSIKLIVVKVVVSRERTSNNCLFVKVFNYFLNCSNQIFDLLASNFYIFVSGDFVTNAKVD